MSYTILGVSNGTVGCYNSLGSIVRVTATAYHARHCVGSVAVHEAITGLLTYSSTRTCRAVARHTRTRRRLFSVQRSVMIRHALLTVISYTYTIHTYSAILYRLKDHRQRIPRFVIRRYLEKSTQKKLFCHLQSLQIKTIFQEKNDYKLNFRKFTVAVYLWS